MQALPEFGSGMKGVDPLFHLAALFLKTGCISGQCGKKQPQYGNCFIHIFNLISCKKIRPSAGKPLRHSYSIPGGQADFTENTSIIYPGILRTANRRQNISGTLTGKTGFRKNSAKNILTLLASGVILFAI
jgi:hypothetical protein